MAMCRQKKKCNRRVKLKIPWIKYFFFGCDCVRCSDALHCTSLRRFYFLLCVFSFYFWSGSTLFSTTLMNESSQRRQQPTSCKPKWKKKNELPRADSEWRCILARGDERRVSAAHNALWPAQKAKLRSKTNADGQFMKIARPNIEKKYINCVVNAVIGNFVSVVRLRGTEIFSDNHGKWLNAPNKCDQPLEQ